MTLDKQKEVSDTTHIGSKTKEDTAFELLELRLERQKEKCKGCPCGNENKCCSEVR